MGHRQKGKSHKRPRSWHRRGNGPDWQYLKMQRKIDKAIKQDEQRKVVDDDAE